MEILYIDIETSPITTYTWGFYNDSALKVVDDWKILGIAYAWNDEEVQSVYPTNVKNWSKTAEKQEKKILTVVWKLLNKADIVVAHNGDKFDIRKINARLIKHGFDPPSPYKTVDTCLVSKKVFGFSQNKLDYLGEYFGFGSKLTHTGLHMWLGCMAGNKEDWDLMEEYNIRDVDLLRNIYYKLRPWIPFHPHIGEVDSLSCPNCGSTEFQSRGTVTMKSGIKYQRYNCKDCGGWFRDKTNEGSPVTRAVSLTK